MIRIVPAILIFTAIGATCVSAEAGRRAKVIRLLDGASLAQWDVYSSDPDTPDKDVWSLSRGVLVCQGKPLGYLITKEEFSDFVLRLEWRWPRGKTG